MEGTRSGHTLAALAAMAWKQVRLPVICATLIRLQANAEHA